MRVVAVPVKRHFQLLVLALIVLASYGVLEYTRHNQAEKLAQLPEIYFYDKLEHPVTLENFKGTVVLVNLWATWCPPCVAELPSLNRLQEKLPGKKFRIVAISLDKSSLKDIQGFLNAKGAKNLDVYWDKDRRVPLKWKYEGLPTSFLLDRTGAVVKRYEGPYAWDTEPLLKEIRALLQ
jgi:thiol-disulfide isomerase/thioredoxin